ncbi:MAG: choice-of-anchor I family protein [Algoriphagus sp.]|nr:choice-of-anchor I family protein [Algoriphagus sp.]
MRKIYLLGASLLLLAGCNERISNPGPVRTSFSEISSLKIGNTGAAEITAFDPLTNQLFLVNNDAVTETSKVDVIDFSDPQNLVQLTPIDIMPYGGGVNSVAAKNGKLAIAVEGFEKTDNGVILIYNTANLGSPEVVVPVGALPDMVIFSPDGRYIVSANEGEPNDDYSIDPEGTVSLIDVTNGYQVTTLGFGAFSGQYPELKTKGFRIFGPNASFAQDIEPEYVTIDATSSFAWVTLQENNGIARVDLKRKEIIEILPMGLKDHSLAGNEIDVSDKDGIKGNLKNWPLLAYYLPDAIESFELGANTFLITANEGDTRDYDAYGEEERVKDLELDPIAFPNAADLQKEANMGRYTATTSAGDTDGDGDFDVLYGIGGRSFTIWNGRTGELVKDYKNLELDLLAAKASLYDDGRSDNKGVEPETVEIGQIRGKNIVFVGLERSDAIMVYELNGAGGLQFLQLLDGIESIGGSGHDAPEGLLFIPDYESPTGRPLLIVSSEGDGRVTVYMN